MIAGETWLTGAFKETYNNKINIVNNDYDDDEIKLLRL